MIRTIATAVLAAVLFSGAPAIVTAQTTATTSANVAALLVQLQALQAQLEALKAAQQKVNETAQSLQGTFALIKELRQGMTSDDVAALQALLAADPSIYPEGLISGYYGHFTATAVKRFQKKYGIEQVGNVGPKTLKKMNEFLKEHPVALENEENGKGKKRPCAIVPPGHLIAAGWLKKHDGVRPIVPPCQTLPQGISKKLGTTTPPTATSTDTTAPVISGVSATNLTATGATVAWTTNELSMSKVLYSTTNPVPTNGTASSVVGTALAYATTHSFNLTGLTPQTTYYYVVMSWDMAGNVASGSQGTFTTAATTDTTAPVISSVSATNITSTGATAIWTTDEVATSKVYYGTVNPVPTSGTTTSVGNTTLVTSHSTSLSGLTPATTYYYVVSSADAAGNTTLSSQGSFVTLAAADTTAPVVSALSAGNIASTSANITWTTDEYSSGMAYVSTTNPVPLTTSFTANHTTVMTTHDLAISGLMASSTYYYFVTSTDAAGNTATSSQQSFMTLVP